MCGRMQVVLQMLIRSSLFGDSKRVGLHIGDIQAR